MSGMVAPLLLGPGNSLAAIGAPWRWVRDTARELGVPLVGAGKKRFVPAGAFLAALEGAGKAPGEGSQPAALPTDPAESIRRALGLVRRTPSPRETATNTQKTNVLGCDCPKERPDEAA